MVAICLFPKLPASYNVFDEMNADDLRRSAGEILNGVHRTVEVQDIAAGHSTNNLFPVDGLLLDTDYLNPVPKDQIVHECGLRSHRGADDDGVHLALAGHQSMLETLDGGGGGNGQQAPSHHHEYYVTDIDPISLGVHMNHHSSHHQHHHSHNDEEEEVLFSDDFNLNYFGMVTGNNIMT